MNSGAAEAGGGGGKREGAAAARPVRERADHGAHRSHSTRTLYHQLRREERGGVRYSACESGTFCGWGSVRYSACESGT